MSKFMITAALAVVLAAPALAQDKGQDKQDVQSQRQSMQDQQMTEAGRQCINELEKLDQRLAGTGYGRPGPGGYGVYGGPYGGATSGRTPATMGAATPRGDMHALMRAGHIMALNGYDEGCQSVVQAVQDIGNRYEEMMRSGEVDEQAMRTWRGDFLASAVPVSQLDRPMRADQIIGADLRTPRDEDLGDVKDVVLAADGSVRYVIVSTGGFLGLGEQEVPVPWSELQVTPSPYRDTLVLDVDQQAFDDAPRLQDQDAARFAQGQRTEKVDQYWDNVGGAKGE